MFREKVKEEEEEEEEENSLDLTVVVELIPPVDRVAACELLREVMVGSGKTPVPVPVPKLIPDTAVAAPVP